MVLSSWREGLRRVLGTPTLIVGVYAVTVLAAAPLALSVRDLIASHLGRSLEAASAADGVNYDWWQEFAAQTTGVGSTFTPAVIGFASTLDSISGVLDGQPEAMPVAVALAFYLTAWTFLSGGILDRYARQRRTHAHGFFAAAGVFFWRFLRVAAIGVTAYWILFTTVHQWLFDDAYTWLTRDLSVERQAFAWRLVLYAVFGMLLVAVSTTLDYTRIRLVVEDRRSALGGVRAALAFIRRNAVAVCGVYALNALLFLTLLAVWAVVAPGAGRTGWSMWVGLLAAQIYLVARLMLKLQFMASQTALFQMSLAHAAYTAAPAAVWPESPAAERMA